MSEQTDEQVREMVLNVLGEAREIKKVDRGFVAPGIFYLAVQNRGYEGSQERLNNLAQEMEEVEGVERGMSQSVHYRLSEEAS